MTQNDESPASERLETIESLVELLTVIQGMGHRLSYETHVEFYDSVKEFNELLHLAKAKIIEIQHSQTI